MPDWKCPDDLLLFALEQLQPGEQISYKCDASDAELSYRVMAAEPEHLVVTVNYRGCSGAVSSPTCLRDALPQDMQVALLRMVTDRAMAAAMVEAASKSSQADQPEKPDQGDDSSIGIVGELCMTIAQREDCHPASPGWAEFSGRITKLLQRLTKRYAVPSDPYQEFCQPEKPDQGDERARLRSELCELRERLRRLVVCMDTWVSESPTKQIDGPHAGTIRNALGCMVTHLHQLEDLR